MKNLIVVDSSADLATKVAAYNIANNDINLASVPLKIITEKREYVDDENLDIVQMINELEAYKGRSSSSCPNVSDWLDAFGDAEQIFCITITSGLSGSYNSACMAKEEYEQKHSFRKVYVIDSLSTGPEMALIADKLAELIQAGESFGDICQKINDYKKKTGLIFMLESMNNLAHNGRVNHIVAKLAGFLGIRVIGKAGDEGTLQQLEKCRGEEKALTAVVDQMVSLGFSGGRVKIADCLNPNASEKLRNLLKKQFNGVDIENYPCRGLCSFYAERGGLIIGFEKE